MEATGTSTRVETGDDPAIPADGIRVEELARRAEVSVDTIRFYQKRQLLPAPQRVGRTGASPASAKPSTRQVARISSARGTGTLDHWKPEDPGPTTLAPEPAVTPATIDVPHPGSGAGPGARR